MHLMTGQEHRREADRIPDHSVWGHKSQVANTEENNGVQKGLPGQKHIAHHRTVFPKRSSPLSCLQMFAGSCGISIVTCGAVVRNSCFFVALKKLYGHGHENCLYPGGCMGIGPAWQLQDRKLGCFCPNGGGQPNRVPETKTPHFCDSIGCRRPRHPTKALVIQSGAGDQDVPPKLW